MYIYDIKSIHKKILVFLGPIGVKSCLFLNIKYRFERYFMF